MLEGYIMKPINVINYTLALSLLGYSLWTFGDQLSQRLDTTSQYSSPEFGAIAQY
jgi:hypothetical protein